MWPSQISNKPGSTLSLRLRLASGLGLLFLIGMIGLYVAVRSHADAASNTSYDRLLQGSALSIAETITIEGDEIRVDLPYAALDMLSLAPEDRVFYAVFGPSGRVVTGNADLPQSSSSGDADGPAYFDSVFKGERVRFVVLGRQIAQPGGTGWIRVQVGQTRRARVALSHDLVVNSLFPIAAMTSCALIYVWFAIGWALTPLKKIGQELGLRQPSELHPIVTPVPSDVEPLVGSLNVFMRRLGQNIETLSSFIAEAAHQMRTPLAALRAQAQTIDLNDPDDLRRGLAAVERNSERLTRLLNQLLSDSTVTHRSDLRKFEEFDLRRTLVRCLSEMVPIRNGARYTFDASVAEAPILGDPIMIAEAFKNLIHNVVHHGHGEENGFNVELERVEAHYVVRILDRGAGIGEADGDKLFERFARNDTQASGFGLGLAIVRRVVDNHGGSVRLSNREGGGVVVEVVLPGATT
jgi:two-component system sensor histidine kinase TctE